MVAIRMPFFIILMQGMMGAKFKRLAKFLTILFGLWKKHAKRSCHSNLLAR